MDRPDQIPEDQIVEFYRDQIAENDSLSSDCVDDILTYATRLEARVKELEKRLRYILNWDIQTVSPIVTDSSGCRSFSAVIMTLEDEVQHMRKVARGGLIPSPPEAE